MTYLQFTCSTTSNTTRQAQAFYVQAGGYGGKLPEEHDVYCYSIKQCYASLLLEGYKGLVEETLLFAPTRKPEILRTLCPIGDRGLFHAMVY